MLLSFIMAVVVLLFFVMFFVRLLLKSGACLVSVVGIM